ncbi:MAG: YihY/virulence factor BrkB family protein [Acidobacteriota bacterium]
MPLFLRRAATLLAQVFDKCGRDNTPLLAAALSFYAMLSFAPALWIILAAAGAVIGRQSAHDAVFNWTMNNMGPAAAQYLAGIVEQINESSSLATFGGVVFMILGATAAFNALQDSLGRIWHQPVIAEQGIVAAALDFARNFFTRRALAFAIMLLLGVLLLVSLLAATILGFMLRFLPANSPASAFWLRVADFLVSELLMMGSFGALYHLLHKKSFAARDIWVGAAVTAVLFAIGKTLIAYYLGTAGLRSAYGAAGSFVLLLLWVYYSAQIFLFGAVFTEVYARLRKTWTRP